MSVESKSDNGKLWCVVISTLVGGEEVRTSSGGMSLEDACFLYDELSVMNPATSSSNHAYFLEQFK